MEDKEEPFEVDQVSGGDFSITAVSLLGTTIRSDCNDNESLVLKVSPPEEDGAVVQSRDSVAVTEYAQKCPCIDKSDGGDAWLAAFMVMIITLTIASEFSTFGIYYVEYTNYFIVSKASIGWIKGIQTLAGGCFGLFGGTFVKIYGCRRAAFLGTFCSFVGMLTASLSPHIHILYITQGIVLGIGLNVMNISAGVIIQLHFIKNPVLGSGVAFMGFTIGSIISPIFISTLLDVYGVRGTLLIHSAIIAHGMPASLLLRTPKTKMSEPDADRLKQPLSVQVKEELCNFALLKDAKFCLLALGGLLLHYTISTFVNHMPGRAVFYGMTRSRAAYLQPVISTSSMFSRMASTLFANYKRVNKLIFFCVVVWFVAIGSLSYGFITDLDIMVIPPIIFGLGMGGSTTVFLVVLVRLVGIDQLPKALGFYTIATSVGLSAGPPLSGIIFDRTHNYDIPFMLASGICMCGNVLFIIVMVLHRRGKYTARTQTVTS
ncbi:hypothetical protein LSH36_313g04021 [Paralvinella palmiformis]|uniref:Major facilitator superfamily (MFS) profile domain-containing protein n=1 Tax=Paralvinella palmiformis TaxID=53620 RepID=A0AAD9JHX2_9ANNE|nr:hypothetical protein LSH36_313g04021 [Paralvinella palmiformis]